MNPSVRGKRFGTWHNVHLSSAKQIFAIEIFPGLHHVYVPNTETVMFAAS